jgi:hypothetical protein
MKLAVYTTIYPGGERYLPDWHRSLQAQTDQDFALWVGLDTLGRETVERLLGCAVDANWVVAPAGATPAQVRQQALLRIVDGYDGVVLVDSDDVLYPSRVAAARVQLSVADLAACALSLVDQQGGDLGAVLAAPPQRSVEEILPRNNVFGFSNSAFRTDLLRNCLPIPGEAVLADWYLATRAWLQGARLAFDATPHMAYRQHPSNTARVTPPFSPSQVISDTDLVRQHFRLVLAAPLPDCMAERKSNLRKVAADIEEFYRQIVLQPSRLESYVKALNTLPAPSLWWMCVANPVLAGMWMEQGVLA